MKLWQKLVVLALAVTLLVGGVAYFTTQSVSWNSGAVSQLFAPDSREQNVSWNSGAVSYAWPPFSSYVSWNSGAE